MIDSLLKQTPSQYIGRPLGITLLILMLVLALGLIQAPES